MVTLGCAWLHVVLRGFVAWLFPSNSLISLSYSMPAFSANSFGLFVMSFVTIAINFNSKLPASKALCIGIKKLFQKMSMLVFDYTILLILEHCAILSPWLPHSDCNRNQLFALYLVFTI